MGNSFGKLFKITTFGESHGQGIGVVIDGCPAGITIDESYIQKQLDRRRPGQSEITTSRDESDKIIIQSGIYKGVTLGTPIGLFVANKDHQSSDYDDLANVYRPSHADYSYDMRFGRRDPRGGGRSSNRESIARVAGGAVAKKFILDIKNIDCLAWVDQVQSIKADVDISKVSIENVEKSITRCPDEKAAKRIEKLIIETKNKGDSLGGIIKFRIKNCPPGLGSPIYNKLTSNIASALISINATRSFDIGLGTSATQLTGSKHNDHFTVKNNKISTITNKSGGVLGGISNGEIIYGSVSFKPTSTIKKEQDTVTNQKKKIKLSVKGRHDPCVLPRAVPIVEAMLNLVIADQLLLYSIATIDRIKKSIN